MEITVVTLIIIVIAASALIHALRKGRDVSAKLNVNLGIVSYEISSTVSDRDRQLVQKVMEYCQVKFKV